jgi:hypothetical protein
MVSSRDGGAVPNRRQMDRSPYRTRSNAAALARL